MQSDDRNPFRPKGAGFPPYLAGREAEQTLFRRFFRTLRRGVPVPSEILVYGPSGNGKTTLLAWAEEQALGEGLDFCRFDSDDIRTPAKLVSGLHLESRLREYAFDDLPADAAGDRVGPRRRLPPLAEALEARAKDAPLVLLVDEAHALEPRIGQWLLNAAQVAGSRAPFLLILAGAPDLRARLAGMGASFWNRAKKVAVGRLADAAAAEAIRRPLAADGIEIEEKALARIVRESRGYPYFGQWWGYEVWKRCHDAPGRGRRVTVAVVDSVAAAVEAERRRFLADTVSVLESDGVLPAAREVARAFGGGARLSHARFREAIARGVREAEGPSEAEAVDALEHLGVVWRTKSVPGWEPGIPSLMDYILEHAPAPGGDAATQ